MNAIDLEVIYQSTLQVARELTLNMLRTGYSTIIKESRTSLSRSSTATDAWSRKAFRSRCISAR